MAELARRHDPLGLTEEALVSDMAIALWRLREAYGWESQEVIKRTNASAAILQGLLQNGEVQELPLFAATQQGWDPRELVVRTGSRSSQEQEALLGDMTNKTGHLIVEAKMTSLLETIMRYHAAIRRDYYRALDALLELQRERLEWDHRKSGR